MIPLKSDNIYAALSDRGFVEEDANGVFCFDTRVVGRYRLPLDGFRLLAQAAKGDALEQVWARLLGRDQQLGLRRRLALDATGFSDRLEFTNSSLAPQALDLGLEAAAHFADLYTLTPIWGRTRPPERSLDPSNAGLRAEHRAADAVRTALRFSVSHPGADRSTSWTLAPGEAVTVTVRADIGTDQDESVAADRPDLAAWREAYSAAGGPSTPAIDQALADMHALLLSWRGRTVIAAGVPWFVCLFGRDALITARFCLHFAPWLARNVLLALADARGRETNPFREEEPGKMPHVQRRGELARTGQVPFGRYYGTADATPLWVWLLADYVAGTGDRKLLDEVRPALDEAVGWMRRALAASGFVQFAPHGGGLKVQSWKDSSDSMSHADGRLAESPIAGVEVQAYAWAALRGASELYRLLGREDEAAALGREAEQLRLHFEEAFWLEDLGTYALALDADGAPLRVLSSNAGHVLWSGIASPDRAVGTARTLLSEPMWSGWGLRTLCVGERRYNPISYHNGGVWPHDTAIFVGGLHRYGLMPEFERGRTALAALADAAPDRRLPELVAGLPREADFPPVPDPLSCRPQAWAAASLPYLELLAAGGSR